MPETISVELAGVPGSGKTTLLEGATPLLEQAGIPVLPYTDRQPLPKRARRFDWWHAVLPHLRADHDGALAIATARTGWHARTPGVLPEGMVNMAWRLAFASGRNPRRLAVAMPVPDLVIHLDVPTEIAAERVAGKTGHLGAANRALRDGSPRTWRRASRVYRRILRDVTGRTTVARIDSTADPEAAARQLVETITTYSATRIVTH